MRRRSGAIHSKTQEGYMKKAEEQSLQYLNNPNSRLQHKVCSTQRRREIDYSELDQMILDDEDDQPALLSMCGQEVPPSEYEEKNTYNMQTCQIMFLCDFSSRFFKEISLLGSYGQGQEVNSDKSKKKLLDLVIITKELKMTESQLVYKLWMHNTLSVNTPTFHKSIIEQVHYPLCSHFYIIFDQQDNHEDLFNQYQRVKMLKGEMFKVTFIEISKEEETKDQERLTNILDLLEDLKNDIGSGQILSKIYPIENEDSLNKDDLDQQISHLTNNQQERNRADSLSSDSSSSSSSSNQSNSTQNSPDDNIVKAEQQNAELESSTSICEKNGNTDQIKFIFHEEEKEKVEILSQQIHKCSLKQLAWESTGNSKAMKMKGSKSQDLKQEKMVKQPRSLSYNERQQIHKEEDRNSLIFSQFSLSVSHNSEISMNQKV